MDVFQWLYGQGAGAPGLQRSPNYAQQQQAQPQGVPRQQARVAPPGPGGYQGGGGSMPFDIPAGVYGMQKWLPGSQGTDIFMPRGSPVTARTGGTVLRGMGGTGLGQGAEMIVQFDDGTFAR